MQIPHLDFLRTLTSDEFPGWGAKLVESLQSVSRGVTNIEQQGNFNSQGTPKAPPQINGVTISSQNGFAHVAIQDANEIYRGVNYHLEHDSSPNFTNPIPVDMGNSRHTTIAIGNQTRYFRVASSYGISGPSKWVYHGSDVQPIAVEGGGSNEGPAFLPSQGSGTGEPGQGFQGPGTIPFRTATGAPPTR
jgi:hypothetical protein